MLRQGAWCGPSLQKPSDATPCKRHGTLRVAGSCCGRCMLPHAAWCCLVLLGAVACCCVLLRAADIVACCCCCCLEMFYHIPLSCTSFPNACLHFRIWRWQDGCHIHQYPLCLWFFHLQEQDIFSWDDCCRVPNTLSSSMCSFASRHVGRGHAG